MSGPGELATDRPGDARLPSDVTPAYLTRALRARGALAAPGRVEAVEPVLVGDFSNRVWRLHLRYASGAPSGPRSLVLKHPRSDRGAERDRAADDFDAEIRFYEELGDAVPVRTPALRLADRERSLLGLEDLTELEPIRFVAGATDAHAARAVDALATLHAAFAGRVAGLAWIPSFADAWHRAALASEFDRDWPARRATVREIAPGFVAIGDRMAGRVADALAPLGRPETLLHGDAHFENLAQVRTSEGVTSVAFHDWAGVRRGGPSFDVAVFVVMSLPPERRRERERDLVARHAAALRAVGVPQDDPWRAYRVGVLAWAVRMMRFSRHAAEQPGPRLVTHRTATAAVDLRVDELV